ncbi:nicotinate-nucleotide--dimethylbenzimidazole phosphoribosyltransferase [Streptomyces sp. NBC_00091]|uniref:nicotinate-nucleotide--dimethylbenzimidazole phosphoribosyltransferase n=1 Tax=Streptomyces sp. NBC_00091 TaxID=2975648 RepID=UPI00225745EE|nr:nicotinate-nucleotide--dimethylbenzimidazole phosphoribosyltransferase [Streptomyces sp. NBC_00091]MCX5379370.1 nicotinate-nucleotide--dimethylbenzimidazole phosphoribosyltransferase [Streptomyces sp. NBC_00091]
MTDTGQVPGEGHPDNAGMVDQQGIPAPVPPMPPLPPMPPQVPAGYAFQDLVDDPAEPEDEELLLMPSGQGSWSDPQVVPPVPAFPGEFPAEPVYTEYPQAPAVGFPEPGHLGFPEQGYPEAGFPAPGFPEAGQPAPGFPEAGFPEAGQPAPGFPDAGYPEAGFPAPAPAPFAEPAAYSAGAHEAGGRDSGALDLGGLVVPQAAPAAQMPPAAPVMPSRRPLHMGPPVPDATGGVVRSLADRGPAAAPAAPVAPVAPQAPAGPLAPAAPALPLQPVAVAPEPLPVPVPAPEAPAAPAPEPLAAAAEPVAATPAAPGPEYLDLPAAAPQPGEIPPLAGTPWTVEPAVPVAAVPVEAAAEPSAEPAPETAPAVEAPAAAEAVAVAVVPEAVVPEAVAPDAVAAEAVAPEVVAVAVAPEAVAPEAVAPEAVAPEAVAPAPETPAEAAPPVAEAVPAVPAAEAAPEAPEAAELPEAPAAVETPAEPQAPAAEPAEPVEAAPAEAVVQDPAPAEPLPEPVVAVAPAEAAPEPASEPVEAEPVAPEVAVEAVEAVEPAPAEAAEPAPAEAAEPAEPAAGEPAPGYDDAEREAVLRVMRERRDIRKGFRTDPIPHEVLLRVLEAAHTAPSVGHSQPWDFVVIRSAETRRTMHELAQKQREAYAKSLPKGRAKQFKELKIEAILDTPVNIVVTADPTRGGRHTLGRHTQPQMAPYSSALAVENLWLAARAEGLGVGWVSFFDEREMVRALGLPEHLEVVAYLCVGYVDEFPEEPELAQAGWSQRRPLAWVVHEETYGRRALPGEAPHDLLSETVASIRPLDAKALGEAWERQKRMTKPAGALGMLEIISAQLSGLSRVCPPPIPEPAAVAIFAGDHGVHAQGVTPWPQEVTTQMVANFLGGGAVCNAFANQVGAEVCVIDVGVAGDLPATPGLLPRKIRPGTADLSVGPAMTREEAIAAIEVGIETARDLVAAGNKALLTGEMGIANTTVSAALISVFTGVDPAEVTGRGTGINDETHARKVDVVRRALELHQPDPADPIGVLAAIGGLEHAAIVGLLLGGASLRTPVILDGVSAGAAALVARAIAPESLSACIAGHRSAEPGHVAALNKLGLRPLIDLDLRLGEGTGALLSLPLVQSAARAMHEVATFDSAGVTEK